jgi:hypothetical protein
MCLFRCSYRLLYEVDSARAEAESNAKYLKPLRKPLARFCKMEDFTSLQGVFQVKPRNLSSLFLLFLMLLFMVLRLQF